MNVDTFKRIASEVLKEVVEEKHVREPYSLMRWRADKDWASNIVITELCATVVRGPEEESAEAEDHARDIVGEICISSELTDDRAKSEITDQILKCLPIYKYY